MSNLVDTYTNNFILVIVDSRQKVKDKLSIGFSLELPFIHFFLPRPIREVLISVILPVRPSVRLLVAYQPKYAT